MADYSIGKVNVILLISIEWLLVKGGVLVLYDITINEA